MYFFYFFSDKYTQDVSKCFVHKWWVGNKPTSRKIVKISKEYMSKHFSEVHAEASIHLSVGE